jgi:hypothetical protein
MRKASLILPGSIALLAVLSAPVLAKSPGAPKAEEKPASSGCSAYEMAPDGTWTVLPCQETGSTGQTRQRSAPHGGDEANH